MDEIRPMINGDEIFIAEIEKKCFSVFWNEDDIRNFYSNDYAFAFTALHDGKIVGYIGGKVIEGDGEIENLAVLPDFRGNSYGTKLCEKLICEMKKRNAQSVFLEVRKSNVPAISIYEKSGFITEYTRKNYYKAPCEDALIMKLNLLTENV